MVESDEDDSPNRLEWLYEAFDERAEEIVANSKKNVYNFHYYSIREYDNKSLRSFPATTVGQFTAVNSYLGVDLFVTIDMSLVAGYYEHACWDWDTEVCMSRDELGDLTDKVEEKFEDWFCDSVYDSNLGMAKIQAKNALAWVKRTRAELIEYAEDIFSKLSAQEVQVVATFSNGEQIYQSCT